MTTNSKKQSSMLSYWIKLLIVYSLIPLTLFVCAGDPGWWQAWVFTAIIFAAGVVGRSIAEKRFPGLMDERIHSETNAGVQKWDKVLAPLMAVSISFPLVIVAGLDDRYYWSYDFPPWLILLGFLLIVAGYVLANWALVENRFFSSTTRIQTERGHTVCDTGPYRLVRHPGYLGNFLALFGIALALESSWTLIPAGFAAVIIIVRTALEDRFLRANLTGYKEYAGRVKFRLLPGIW